ncbi:MAG: hypothetical protein II838_06575 [Lachnospiraceae bacterium]|nr:hypothetical protein [Lachnospiraceae bacterium]
MDKKIICGKSFEELSNEEMMEFEGGAIWTTLSTTTAGCVAASVVVSAGVSLVVTCFGK